MKHPLDITAILATIVGVASLATDAAFGGDLSTVAGAHTPLVLAIIGGLGLVAGKVLSIIKTNQSDAQVAAGSYPTPAPLPPKVG